MVSSGNCLSEWNNASRKVINNMAKLQNQTGFDFFYPDVVQVQEITGSLKQRLYAYRGTSMFPTLKEPDALEIIPFGGTLPATGDIVVCLPPEHEDYVVHRVTRITAQGIYTQGDNARMEDPWVLYNENIAGRVVFAWRYRKRRKIAGGLVGRIQCRINRLFIKVIRWLYLLVKPLYELICNNGAIHRLLPKQLRPRLVRFVQQGTPTLRLIWLDKMIGYCDVANGMWKIVPPYKLVVDPEIIREADFSPSALEKK